MRIVFFGTPEFAVESLDRLVTDGHDVAAVVTMPDKRGGRGNKVIQSDVKRYAEEHGLKVLQPEKLRDTGFLDELRAINADLFVVIAFRMLPECVWAMPPKGTFNLHASLLPRYRGAAPINWAIINGDKVTGVTTFFLTHEIDTGDIIARRETGISESDNAGTLHDRLMEIGAEMTAETVKAIERGDVKTMPQPEGEFVPAPKIFKDTCRIDWDKDTVTVNNLIRGLSPYPAAWTTMSLDEGSQLDIKIFEANPCEDSGIDETERKGAGFCHRKGNRLFVETADGVLELLSVQPSGKKRMDVSAFLQGYRPVVLK